jgi:hypothetical protein
LNRANPGVVRSESWTPPASKATASHSSSSVGQPMRQHAKVEVDAL